MKAIVCGAGIAGLTAAWSLARSDWDVLLIEKAPGLREEGYMIDFFGPGFDVAERMGILAALRERAYDIPEAVWVDGRGRREASLNYALFQRAENGRILSLMRGDLERTLYEALPNRIARRFGAAIAEINLSTDHVEAVLAGGETVRADLLVGADGIHSTVRACIFGPEERYFRYLGYHTAAYIFEDPAIGRALAGRVWIMSVPGREVGLYATRTGIASFFVHATPDPNRPRDALAELKHVYGAFGWLVPATLAGGNTARAIYYDQVAQVAMERWHRGRVVLIGDAAYAVSLLAGQGASLAMAGGYRLGESLADGAPVEDALARFEAGLREVVANKQQAGRNAAQWIAPRDRRHILLRNWSLRLAKLPGVSRLIARSLTGAPERFMK
jgi:2-polyprenyl-6-methoxyphenol hydroxylase-like FAD-dependent oxidoreductase